MHMVKGFYVHSMPPFRAELQQRGERLAILRLDGDIYDSTVDVLYNLYDLVEVGGFVVIDDFGWGGDKHVYGARDATLDFRYVHGIEDDDHVLHRIDDNGAWFRKARHVTLQRERYLHSLDASSKREATQWLRPAGTPYRAARTTLRCARGGRTLPRTRVLHCVDASTVAIPMKALCFYPERSLRPIWDRELCAGRGGGGEGVRERGSWRWCDLGGQDVGKPRVTPDARKQRYETYDSSLFANEVLTSQTLPWARVVAVLSCAWHPSLGSSSSGQADDITCRRT